MFREALESVLEFIGYHSEHRGCKGSELLSFISTDVLPHYGLGQHSTMQQTVMNLLLSETDSFTVKSGGKTLSSGELTSTVLQYDSCAFCPTRALQEKTVGYSLRTATIRAAVNYACENMLFGFLRNQPGRSVIAGREDDAASRGMNASASGLSVGVRTLLRDKWLKCVFVFHRVSKVLELCVLPYFAMPVPPRQQHLQPLQSYLKRCRAHMRDSRVVIDINVVRHIVLSSPERRLVYQDALHAVFEAYGETVPGGNGRAFGRCIGRLLRAADLRVVRASITTGYRTHRVSVVVDARARLNGDGGHTECTAREGGEDGEEGNTDVSSDSGGSEDSGSADDNPGNGFIEWKSEVESAQAPLARIPNGGTGGFHVDPAFPLPLQVVKQAERNPIALELVLPRVVFYDSRNITKELYRYTTTYEERYGTIESTNALCAYGKSFTRVLQPKGWSGKHKSGYNEQLDGSLPKGVTVWAVSAVLDALNASPLRAMTLVDLVSVVDRRTLGRVLPVLQRENRVTTTGVTLPQGRRLGVLVVAGVKLTDADREELIKRHNSRWGAHSQGGKPLVRLNNIPSPGGGESGQANSVIRLPEGSSRTARIVTKITMIRNGYSRVGVFRHSRLHLELCRVWCLHNLNPTKSLTLGQLLQEMSLSSFCIVVGVGDVDLTSYISERRCSWGTSMRHLPPTLQEHCSRSGLQPLIHSLSVLQARGLVMCDRVLRATEDVDPDELFITLAKSTGRVCEIGIDTGFDDQPDESWEYVFFPTGGPDKPQETCRAVMQYWGDCWKKVSNTKSAHDRLGAFICEAVTVEPNITDVQIFALSWLLRVDCSIMAEHLLQRLGYIRTERCARQRRGRGRAHMLTKCATAGYGHASFTRLGARPRGDLTAKSVADVIVDGLQSDELEGNLARLEAKLLGKRRETLEGYYSPYCNRVHGSMLTIVQGMLRVVQREGGTYSRREASAQPKNTVVSFASPHLAAAEGLSCDDKRTSVRNAEPNDLRSVSRRLSSSIPPSSRTANRPRKEPPEVLQDIVRMILLSDEAHYDAVAAKALLAQFKVVELDNCIDWLLTFPSFRNRSSACGRLPRVELAPRCKLLHLKHAERVTHSQCASASYAHTATVSMLFLPQSNCRRWCIPPILQPDSLLLQTAPRLIEQPFPDIRFLSSNTQEGTELSALRVPRFAPPPRTDEKKMFVTTRTGVETTCVASNIATSATTVGCISTSAAKVPTEPYPARFLLRPWKRLRYLDLLDIPVDPPPTSDQCKRARSATVTSTEEGRDDTPTLPQYPSVFHHVDGSFHVFFWRSFLFAVYALIHNSPGITEERVMQELVPSGLVSHAACKMAINFLKASLVITVRSIVQACGEVDSPFRSEASTMAGGDAAKATMKHVDCYFCTISQDGPWNVVNL